MSAGSLPARAQPATTASAVAGSGALGVAFLALAAVANIVLWLAGRPADQPNARFIGELCGAEAVLFFSCALVLATLLRPIERAFGGLDRVTVWHRRSAEAGTLLLIPHVVLATSSPDRYAGTVGRRLGDLALVGLLVLVLWAVAPSLRAARWPGPIRRMASAAYQQWVRWHRLTGLFVIVAVVHAVIVDPVLHRSTLLRDVFLAIGCTGALAYLYRELLGRYVVPTYDYTVATVQRLNKMTLNVSLQPQRRPLEFSTGQFVFIRFGGPLGWEWHPFTVSSSNTDARLALTIKASGDYTNDLFHKLRAGTPARLAGPFGGFDYRIGGHDQIWIAGGIGVTPFLSWIRSIDGAFDRDVDFYYSVADADDAIYIEEIHTHAARHPSLRVHLIATDTDGRLMPDRVMAAVAPGTAPWVYMCGPPPMMRALDAGLRRAGIPRNHLRWEEFSER